MKRTTKAKCDSAGGKDPKKIHFTQIDILKGLAIISVVLIHTYNNDVLNAIGAPFYLLQAVPVFLLLAAFNNAYSLSSSGKSTLVQSYDLAIIYRRLKRLILPYWIIWIFQLIVVLWLVMYRIELPLQDLNQFFYNNSNWIFNFLSGASGPGHYFIPLMIQFVFIIPFFYYLATRSPNRMLVVSFILDLVLEYLSVLSGMSSGLYGILCIRYIFICGLGVWLVFQERKMNRWIAIGGLLSGLYILAVCYLGIQFWIFSVDPYFYHAFAFFWTLAIVVLGFQYLPSDPGNRIVKIVTELGKASWHIFLVQMTFFFLFEQSIHLELSFVSIIILAVIYLVPCLSIGYGFYWLEEYFTKGKKNILR